MLRVPQARFANLYGPTETNVCTWYEVETAPNPESSPIPIGRSIPNDRAYALKDDGTEAQIGEVGELLVRGATVMKGYWGDRIRTDRSLIIDPLAPERRDPVYRTGDLVELLEDGSFRYLGRRDAQVKSRGFRIELGDIESALNAHPLVEEAAVIATPDELITNRLVAFVSTTADLADLELASFCAERLPQYMIPESFAFLPALPKTYTGKIDRRLLGDSALDQPNRPASAPQP
jgi:acyl-coenzyme A synthetase/AMP-(fatty) acid ligase